MRKRVAPAVKSLYNGLMLPFSRRLRIAAIALLCPALAAAADPSPLRFRLTGDPTTLDWSLAQTSYETYVIMNIMEGRSKRARTSSLIRRWPKAGRSRRTG